MSSTVPDNVIPEKFWSVQVSSAVANNYAARVVRFHTLHFRKIKKGRRYEVMSNALTNKLLMEYYRGVYTGRELQQVSFRYYEDGKITGSDIHRILDVLFAGLKHN